MQIFCIKHTVAKKVALHYGSFISMPLFARTFYLLERFTIKAYKFNDFFMAYFSQSNIIYKYRVCQKKTKLNRVQYNHMLLPNHFYLPFLSHRFIHPKSNPHIHIYIRTLSEFLLSRKYIV